MPDRTPGALIIGASQAGVQVACSLRELGFEDPITIVGAETHMPYQRPPLSKALLSGTMTPADLIFRSEDFYRDASIDLVLGERVTDISTRPDGSGSATTQSGRQLAFDKLALAVGVRARRLQVPGAGADGVLYLRDADDALELKSRLSTAQNVVVIGGGFIGLEVAASASKLGKNVSVLCSGTRLMGRAVGELTSQFFTGAHLSQGVDLRFGIEVESILQSNGRAIGVRTTDGSVIDAELIVIGIGAEPRVELAEQLGLDIDDGIVVDEFSRASDGFTVATGDCANFPNPLSTGHGPKRLRWESVNNAIEHAKVAAATVAGFSEPYRAVPWFWSDQFDIKLQVAGVSTDHDATVTRGDPSAGKFSVLYYWKGRLVAADCINSPLDFLAVKSALAADKTIPMDLAGDVGTPLKKLSRTIDGPFAHVG
jgi:3-phenylpropionate/trans-cinnamate dioxygenase ferredoxin reductase subunit